MQTDPAATPAAFIVFFDWAKPDINRDAAEILDKAAGHYAAQAGSRIVLAGHSDRSGPAGANLRSSRKRAEAVRDYLTAHGVPAGAISLHAYGEERPIVETEDGVREVQNRRVEIRVSPASMQASQLVDASGNVIGQVKMSEGANGLTLKVTASGLPAGTHGVHLHEKGICEGPKFVGAGAHWNPAVKQHGRDNPMGAHLGDLANMEAADGAEASSAYQVAGVTMAGTGTALTDADGTSLVVHAKADDYKTDPSGNSGDRIACAVLAPPMGG